VKIYEITDINYNYPKLSFTCKVSSGTYIRSLAEDIGQALGAGAYLSALRRTSVGEFDLKNTLKIEDLSLGETEKNLQK
jgi:tRNA pseudouridine55 synthase